MEFNSWERQETSWDPGLASNLISLSGTGPQLTFYLSTQGETCACLWIQRPGKMPWKTQTSHVECSPLQGPAATLQHFLLVTIWLPKGEQSICQETGVGVWAREGLWILC